MESNHFPVADLLRFGIPLWMRLGRHESFSQEQVKRFQEKKLRQTVAHAAAHVPYYRDLFRQRGLAPQAIQTLEDLREIPLLTREDIQAQGERLIAETSDRKGLRFASTTGSTGTPLRVAVDGRERVYRAVLALYIQRKLGRRLGDKVIRISVPAAPRHRWLHERLGWWRQYQLDLRDGVEQNLQQLRAMQPQVLFSYPSYLSLLSRHLLEDPTRYVLRPRLIVAYGEVLTPQARALIGKAFGCQIRSSYGSVESNGIAYECPSHALHVIPAGVIVEVDERTRDGAGCGEILVTSLWRRTMPLLRYRLGDRVRLGERPCPCGATSPIIEEIAGRADDFITLPSGRRLSARAINVLEGIPGILEYQIVQRRRELFEIRVRPGSSFDGRTEEKIREVIARGCLGEPVQVHIVCADRIPRLRTGKLCAVVSVVDAV